MHTSGAVQPVTLCTLVGKCGATLTTEPGCTLVGVARIHSCVLVAQYDEDRFHRRENRLLAVISKLW